MTIPVATIIIPCIKNNDILYECLDKCSELSSKIDIIVVTEDEIPVNNKYENVKFINVGNVNMSIKRNIAVSASQTKYVAFIDSDAKPKNKQWINNAIQELESDSEIGMVGGPELSPEKQSKSEKWVGLSSQSYLITGSHCFRKKLSPRQFYSEMSGCNLIMLKKDYCAIGGMNKDLYIGEDQDLGRKVREDLNKKILFSPKVIVYHKNREFFQFLIQRYARGMAVASSIRFYLFELFKKNAWFKIKDFRLELFVAPAFIVFLLTIAVVPIFFPWIYIYLIVITIFLLTLIIETFKQLKSLSDYPGVFVTLLSGVLISGVAALLSLININPNIKKLYRNKNDI